MKVPRKILKTIGAICIVLLGATACQTGGTERPVLSLEEAKKVTSSFARTSIILPPRSINDILQQLDNAKPLKTDSREGLVKPDESPPQSKDPSVLRKFFQSRGRALKKVGRRAESREDFLKAYKLLSQGSHSYDAVKYTVQDLAYAETSFGNLESGIKYHEEVLAKSGSTAGRQFDTRARIAVLHLRMGDIAAAEAKMAEAESIYDDAKSWRHWDRYEHNWVANMNRKKAEFLERQGKYKEAEPLYRGAVQKMDQFFEGDYTWIRDSKSLYYFNRIVRFWAQRALAKNLFSQGRLIEAEIEARKALRYSLRNFGPQSSETASALRPIIWILEAQGRLTDGETLARRSLKILKQSKYPPQSTYLGWGRSQLASSLVRQERWQEAMSIYDALRDDMADHPKVFRMVLGSSLTWAMTMVKNGKARNAIPIAQESLRRRKKLLGPEQYRTAEARGILAAALAATGEKNAALKAFSLAVPVLVKEGGKLLNASAGTHQRRKFIIETYMDLLLSRGDDTSESDLGRAISLADGLRSPRVQQAISANAARAASGDPDLADLVRRQQDSSEQLEALYGILAALADKSKEITGSAEKTAVLYDRIARLRSARDVLGKEIEKRFPKFADLINPQPATVTEVRSTLRPGEALIALYVTHDRTYVWAIPVTGRVVFATVSLGREAIADMVAELRVALDPQATRLGDIPDFNISLAYELYEKLLKPVKSGWQDAKNLIIVGDGPLGQLPLGLLPTEPVSMAKDGKVLFDRYRGVPWLVRKVSLTRVPSITSFVTLRRLSTKVRGKQPFAGFGDPYFNLEQANASKETLVEVAALGDVRRLRRITRGKLDDSAIDSASLAMLPRLPETGDEIREIGEVLGADPKTDIFLGKMASEERVKAEDLSERRVLMFATHALVSGDLDGLNQPALALTSPAVTGGDGDGLLTMGEILGLKLNADWVVLSACNTAAGDGKGAEAVSGLGRAFFYAGARALLATHWPVESRSAKELTTTLFRRQAANDSLSRAGALREAMLALIDGNGFVDPKTGKLVFSYAHPLFWAPFSLIGDGGGGRPAS